MFVDKELSVYSDFDLKGIEHYVIPFNPLYELKTENSFIETTLFIDGDGSCGLHFYERKEQITEIYIIDLEIDKIVQSLGYGTILMKALIHIQKQLGIQKFYISGEISNKDNVRKNIDFYNNFVKIYKQQKLEVFFYKSRYNKSVVNNIYDSRWFEIYVK